MDENKLLKIIEWAAKEKATKLNLAGKGITSLPAEIGKLTNLTELYLDNNQLKNVPTELGELTKLLRLTLYGNQLTSIPVELGNLTNLTRLWLYNNQLTSIPVGLGNLTNLTRLSLSDNQLTSTPVGLGNLTNLTRLSLSDNQLTSIPVELGNLTNLTRLSLSDNQLTSIPSELGNLTNLTDLWLHKNQLTSIPSELGKLTNLAKFSLDVNQLTSIPSELGNLTKLTKLGLSYNELTSIPPDLGKLTNLTVLDLAKNQLTSIPVELGKLTKLDKLSLDGNEALTSPQPEVVEQGTKAILAYLRGLKRGKRKRYEAKLLILGDSNEGKTCVSRALRGLPFEHQSTTEGVDIEPWEFGHPDSPKDRANRIKLNVWDFEGQEINHQSHQFFLTRRALYLLVFKGRDIFSRARVEYWLDTIRSRAPESEVVLVATECESRTPHVPVTELRARYPDLLKHKKCFFEVGCKTNKGVPGLQKHLQERASKLDVMGTDWPEGYAKAEDAIEKRAVKEAHISRKSMYGMFKRSGIRKDDYENAARLMGFLGVITHFPDSEALGDFVVLKPQWLTKAMSELLEDKQLERDQGEITHRRLHGIWETKYEGLAETFHKCLREFELCYDLEYQRKHLSLIPLRFGFAKPKKIRWSAIPSAKERRIEYRFQVTPPAGIMSRFIVKTHHMIVKTREYKKGIYWYNGVFLGLGEEHYRSEALCEFDADKRLMSITVRAAFPQSLVGRLVGFAEAVFSFFDGLEPVLQYGCFKGEGTSELQCVGTHREQDVLFTLSQKAQLPCADGNHMVDPLNLVMGLTKFDKIIVSPEALERIVAKGVAKGIEPLVATAEQLLAGMDVIGRDVMALLVMADKCAGQIEAIREQGRKLPEEFLQRQEANLWTYFSVLNKVLDNREYNSAPGMFCIVPADAGSFRWDKCFNEKYALSPFCEYERGVHRCEGVWFTFKKSKRWWVKTAPKVSFVIRMLGGALKMGLTAAPMAMSAEAYKEVKDAFGFMKELSGRLEKLKGGAESDISERGAKVLRKGERGIIDVRQGVHEDEQRLARIQLSELLKDVAPENYKAMQWGLLTRIPMSDNTYRWLCHEHAAEYKK